MIGHSQTMRHASTHTTHLGSSTGAPPRRSGLIHIQRHHMPTRSFLDPQVSQCFLSSPPPSSRCLLSTLPPSPQEIPSTLPF